MAANEYEIWHAHVDEMDDRGWKRQGWCYADSIESAYDSIAKVDGMAYWAIHILGDDGPEATVAFEQSQPEDAAAIDKVHPTTWQIIKRALAKAFARERKGTK